MDVKELIKENGKKSWAWLKVVLIAALIGLLIWLAYRYIYIPIRFKVSDEKINADILKQSSDPKIAAILHEGVESTLNSYSKFKQACDYATASGTDINQVLVTEAIQTAKSSGYLN